MGKKGPIRCVNCGGDCVEVGHTLSYPKAILDPESLRKGRKRYEYRYACPHCGAEYVHETSRRQPHPIPRGADINIRIVKGQEIIQVNSPTLLKYWGLSPEQKGIELTAQEVGKLQERAQRIRNGLSDDHLEYDILVWERFRLTNEQIRELLGRGI